MAQRPQPSLRLADGGSFITRWAQSVMRPNATANRLREADAPPPPPAAPASAPVRAPAPPPPNPNATPDNPAGIRFQDGGHVPGTGTGDKIPAKYEPGEFVVSNDMIDDNPGLREQLSGLRADTLAARGKTVEEADAKALRYHGGLRGGEYGQETRNEELPSLGRPSVDLQGQDRLGAGDLRDRRTGGEGARHAQVSLRAADGFDPLDRMARNLTGQNSLPPRSPVGNMADELARNARAAVPEGPAVRPTAPLPPDAAAAYDSSPEGRATKVQALKDTRGYFQGNPSAAPTGTAPPAPTATTPSTASKWFGAADDWKGMAGSQAGSLKLAPPEAPGRVAKGFGALQGAAGAYNAYQGIQEGDAWKTGVGAADAVAGAALFTPAAPIAGAYLGVRGAYDTAKAAGGAIYNNLSEGARDVVGGTVNQIGLNTGLWGVDDSAKMQMDAAAPTTLRKTAPGAPTQTRPEDTFAGPPAAAAGAASPATDPGAPRRVDRPGQSPLFTNVADDAPYIGNNALMARGNGPNAQNMAAANNLAATDSLRSQGAALGGQSAGGSGMPAMPQTLHSGNDWASRKSLENLRTSASSIYDSQSRWGNKAKAAADANVYQNAQAMDAAKQAGADPGSVSRTKAGADMFGSKTAADASRYGSDNSLRGQMYSSDAQLGAKRMEMQRGLRQQQVMGELWKASGGDPAKFQSLAMQYGLPDAAKQGGDMVAARQTQAKANSEDAQSTFKGMFLDKEGKPDAGGEAMAHHAASQIVPGWENMSQEQRNAARPRVVEYVNMLQQANNNRDTGWLQKAGITKSSDMRSQMPDMTGATLSDVGWWEGATTPNIGRGDKKVTLKSGAEMHFDSLNEAQKRLLEINGVRQQK